MAICQRLQWRKQGCDSEKIVIFDTLENRYFQPFSPERMVNPLCPPSRRKGFCGEAW